MVKSLPKGATIYGTTIVAVSIKVADPFAFIVESCL